MSDLAPPDLDSIPTVPPPPPSPEPTGPSIDFERRQQRRAQRASTPFWRVVALILVTQAALVSSAVLVAVGRPSWVVSSAALVLTNVFITVVLARSR